MGNEVSIEGLAKWKKIEDIKNGSQHEWNKRLAIAFVNIATFLHRQNTVDPYNVSMFVCDIQAEQHTKIMGFNPRRSFIRSLIPWRWGSRQHALSAWVQMEGHEWRKITLTVNM